MGDQDNEMATFKLLIQLFLVVSLFRHFVFPTKNDGTCGYALGI
jgi:hypothetical protein